MSDTHLRYEAPIEFREDVTRGGPGRISGVILPFGRVAGDRREVFIPGSVTIPDGGITLLAEHRGREVMRFTPVERDGELRIDASLPDTAIGREVAEDVRSGRRAGLSVEFHALADAMVQTVREIRSALLTGAAIVPAGAYAQATAEVRARADHRRVLASATVEGDGGAVDPHLLEGVGTDLVRAGRFLGRLTVGPGARLRILRAGAVASVVYGDADPDSWRYSLSMGGPSSARTVWATAAETVNVRINSDSYRPWEGIAPLARAVASGQLAARLAASLGDEADVVVSRILPISQGSGEGAANQLSKAIAGTLPGRLAFPETQLAGAGAGRSSAPLRDFGGTRTGWEAPPSAATIYAHMFSEVCEICGVPAQLVNPASAGPAAREAWRRLTVGTIEPYARLLESELSRVLERPVTITLRRLGGVDAAGRARALHVLVEAGFTPEAAQELLGWD